VSAEVRRCGRSRKQSASDRAAAVAGDADSGS